MIKTGYIYKIFDNTNGNIYYGSTSQSLSQRITNHRSEYKKYLDGRGGYTKSFDILKNNDYSYSVVEKVEYNEKYELRQRERFYIENNDCVNIVIPLQTRKEYNQIHKTKLYEKKKEWNNNNREKVLENKKNFYHNNKERINEKRRVKVNCPQCNKEISNSNLSRHLKLHT